jgi:hypothetical protein
MSPGALKKPSVIPAANTIEIKDPPGLDCTK